MLAYTIKRLIQAVPVLFITSLFIFIGLRLAPGDPAELLAGPNATPAAIETVRHQLGLDLDYGTQYYLWLRSVLSGDLGRSLINGLPVSELLLQRVGPTLELAAFGFVASMALGILLGIISGMWPGSIVDRVVSLFSALGISMPVFWSGMLLIYIFGVQFRWLPVAGRVPFSQDVFGALTSLALPTLALAIGNAPIVARFLRDGIQENRRADHVRTAHAKGLPQWQITRDYIVRNSLIPVVTAAGAKLGNLIGGTALVEIVFSWPGLGSLLVDSMGNRDYGVVQAALLFAVLGFLLSNLIVDILYGFLDPRVRHATFS
jgi:ABC-type dipeptide/oligopeptide/nickel transport system permease component